MQDFKALLLLLKYFSHHYAKQFMSTKLFLDAYDSTSFFKDTMLHSRKQMCLLMSRFPTLCKKNPFSDWL